MSNVNSNNDKNKSLSVETGGSANTKAGNNTNSIKKNNKPELPKSLYEFIRGVYEGKKINQETRKAFKNYQDTISEQHKDDILEIANKNDPECRITLYLADFFLETNLRSRNNEILLSCIEYIVSNYASLNNVKTNTIFQSWLDQSEGLSDKLSFFAGQIDSITFKDDKENIKPLREKPRNNILCIAAIWLYSKKASDFNSLLRYLSRSAFTIKGEKGSHVESAAFAFASSMITSTKKSKFAYFLSKVSEHEKTLSDEVSQKTRSIYQLEAKLEKSRENNNHLLDSVNLAENTIATLTAKIDKLNKELLKKDEHDKHKDIHHTDSQHDLKARFHRLLEGELGTLLNNAKIANSRVPPKTEVVDYQLNDALEIIEKELRWLKL